MVGSVVVAGALARFASLHSLSNLEAAQMIGWLVGWFVRSFVGWIL